MLDEANSTDYLFENEESDEIAKPVEALKDSLFLEGICPKCLDSGFVHTVKDGVLGIVATTEGQDSVGKPVKRLQLCDHSFKHTY